MKSWFVNRCPDLIATILIGFAMYHIGVNTSRFKLMVNVDECAKQAQQTNYIGDYYKHNGPTSPNGYYAHAEAFTEMIFAKCMRKEINK
jgi:hypothetical protein